jgi:hypothetical protein
MEAVVSIVASVNNYQGSAYRVPVLTSVRRRPNRLGLKCALPGGPSVRLRGGSSEIRKERNACSISGSVGNG